MLDHDGNVEKESDASHMNALRQLRCDVDSILDWKRRLTSFCEARAVGANVAKKESLRFNNCYTLESYVCGPSNRFAFAACEAVANSPGEAYSPLFISGGVGLGKTHLLSAVGRRILQHKPDAKVVFVSSEQFINQVIDALLGSKLEQFRRKYREECDVLLMDDVHLIAGKERTQQELLHIFNSMHDSQRQFVFTSDKRPQDIPDLEMRLRSRFQCGLLIQVKPPAIETCAAILRKIAAIEGLDLPEDVIVSIAHCARGNVFELEGLLASIIARSNLTGISVTESARLIREEVAAEIVSGKEVGTSDDEKVE